MKIEEGEQYANEFQNHGRSPTYTMYSSLHTKEQPLYVPLHGHFQHEQESQPTLYKKIIPETTT